jgi:hypothetical protein
MLEFLFGSPHLHHGRLGGIQVTHKSYYIVFVFESHSFQLYFFAGYRNEMPEILACHKVLASLDLVCHDEIKKIVSYWSGLVVDPVQKPCHFFEHKTNISLPCFITNLYI